MECNPGPGPRLQTQNSQYGPQEGGGREQVGSAILLGSAWKRSAHTPQMIPVVISGPTTSPGLQRAVYLATLRAEG